MKKLKWYEGREVTEQERKAINEILDISNFLPTMNEDDIQRWIDDDTISLNTCRNKRDAVWALEGDFLDVAVYVDTLEQLSEEEIEKEWL